jgi:hypothetical protein
VRVAVFLMVSPNKNRNETHWRSVMFSKFRHLFSRGEHRPKLEPRVSGEDDLSWLIPPTDPLDVAGWDRYWTEQVKHGLGPPLFDMFCDDRKLIEVMNKEELKSVLCAGNGISQEPRALAQAGFQVVALDFSPRAVDIARGYEFPAEGFKYYCKPGFRRPGGHADLVLGDILDPAVCPGPFDVIIERRTAQLFLSGDMGAVLGALAKRLGPKGIFVSHCHDGAWRPPAAPRHFTEPWFKQQAWTIWKGGPDRKPPGQVAWLVTSTG